MKGEILEVRQRLFEKINDATFYAEDESLVRCLVACKMINLSQVRVFDILENHADIEQQRNNDVTLFDIPKSTAEKSESLKSINFDNDATENLILKISWNLSQIVLTDLHDKFVLSQ